MALLLITSMFNDNQDFLIHLPLECLFNSLGRLTSNETWKLRITGPCEGNPPVTGGFPSQRVSNVEIVSI